MRQAPAGLVRRFALIIAAGGLPIIALLVGLAATAYQGARTAVLERHRQATLAREAGLEQLVSVTRHHVTIMRDFLAQRLVDNGKFSATRGGLGDESNSGPARGVIASPPGALEAPGTRRRLDAAEALFPVLRAAHGALPQLRWSYVFDAEAAFVAMYPFAPLSELLPQAEGQANGPAERYTSWFSYDVFLDARPERNPTRAAYWTPAYIDAGGAGPMVSHAAPVDIDGRFRAMVGTDILLGSLSGYLREFPAVDGRFAVADQQGSAVADPGGGIAAGGEAIPALRDILGFDVPSPALGHDGFLRLDGDHVIARTIAGTPWVLLHAVSEAEVRSAAMREVVPYAVLGVGILTGLLGLYVALSHQFVRPAARITAFAERMASAPGEAPPAVPGPWRPFVARIAAAGAEQRRLTAELRAAESLKSAVLDAALDAVVIADESGTVIGFNPGAERIFNRCVKEVIGCRIGDMLVPEALRSAHEAGMARFRRTGEARVLGRRLEVEAMRADGSIFPAELAIQRVAAEGRTAFAAYLRDLTAERAAAAEIEAQRGRIHQVEKLSAMGSLLAGVAHELNNPLAILVAQSVLLREKAPTPDLQRRAERIHAAASRAGRIVKSFLAMARQEAPRREPVQVNEVIDAAAEMTAYGARSAGIAVDLELDPTVPTVQGDRDLLGQVIANLLINAQQALLDRHGPRRIRMRSAHDGTGMVVIEVVDNGPGVPEAIAGRIFEAYFTTKPSGAGTGIGLAICRDVVEAHGGRISLDAAPGGGALFRIRLPVTKDENGMAAAVLAPHRPGLSVLVVDDEPDMATSLAEMIEGLGHRAVVVDAAAAALEHASRQHFDVVFADLRMPGMNGADLRRRLAQCRPGLDRRTVIVTGDTVLGTRSVPADAVILEKPFAPDEIQAALRHVFRAT